MRGLMLESLKAVFFDFDGVLGRTMEDNFRAWRHAFSGRGISVDREKYFLIEGYSAKKIAECFLEENGRDRRLGEELMRLKDEYYLKNASFSLYEGAEDLVRGLKKKGFLTGIVSGGSSRRLRKSLDEDFLNCFDVIVTGDSILQCKPHPEPYLSASEAVGCSPEECMAVENAPMGIRSAKSAGMSCVAITSTLPRNHLKDADLIVESILELKTRVFEAQERHVSLK